MLKVPAAGAVPAPVVAKTALPLGVVIAAQNVARPIAIRSVAPEMIVVPATAVRLRMPVAKIVVQSMARPIAVLVPVVPAQVVDAALVGDRPRNRAVMTVVLNEARLGMVRAPARIAVRVAVVHRPWPIVVVARVLAVGKACVKAVPDAVPALWPIGDLVAARIVVRPPASETTGTSAVLVAARLAVAPVLVASVRQLSPRSPKTFQVRTRSRVRTASGGERSSSHARGADCCRESSIRCVAGTARRSGARNRPDSDGRRRLGLTLRLSAAHLFCPQTIRLCVQ
jgi:hypothetical protein